MHVMVRHVMSMHVMVVHVRIRCVLVMDVGEMHVCAEMLGQGIIGQYT
jgi:hypothetical protein